MIYTDENGDFVRVEGMWNYKYMKVSRLKELISELEDDDEISVNRVGNINVYRPTGEESLENGDPDFRWIATINIGSEEIKLWEEGET